MTERRRRRIPLEKTEEPGVFFDPFKQRYTVVSELCVGSEMHKIVALSLRNPILPPNTMIDQLGGWLQHNLVVFMAVI
jgi:hypothetical protein